jgi:hypothetical protein
MERVGGHQYLPAGGHDELRADGHLVTLRAREGIAT